MSNTNHTTTSSSSSSSTTNTTTTTTHNQETIEITHLRQHIQNCTTIPSNSIAIRVTLQALETQLKKMNRDETLRMKFAKEQREIAAATAAANAASSSSGDDEEVADTKERNTKRQTVQMEDKLLMEWHDVDVSDHKMGASMLSEHTGSMSSLVDVAVPPSMSMNQDPNVTMGDTDNDPDRASPLGTSLAQLAISDMTDAGVLISSPVAAVALALHSILRSSIVGFNCTGIPEEDSSKNGGFAPPVRELPKGQFLPRKWDEFAKVSTELSHRRVSLRYRKNGFGASVLKVFSAGGAGEGADADDTVHNMIHVQFGTSGGGGETNKMSFPLERHINDDSMTVALASSSAASRRDTNQQTECGGEAAGVKPALHYKALPVLVTQFCNTFDLGSITDKDADTSTINVPLMYQTQPSSKAPSPPFVVQPMSNTIPQFRNDTTMPSIPIDVRERGIPNGDFSGDLMPGGTPRPSGMPEGNLMGPSHQIFQRDFENDFEAENNSMGPVGFPTPGGLGMQPRFDPFYPPGVQGNVPGRGVKRGRGRGRGRFTGGDPNPDHQRPPNNLGGNMFM